MARIVTVPTGVATKILEKVHPSQRGEAVITNDSGFDAEFSIGQTLTLGTGLPLKDGIAATIYNSIASFQGSDEVWIIHAAGSSVNLALEERP